jgi:Homeodomain
MQAVPERGQGVHPQSHVLQANLMRFPTRVYNPSTIRHRIRTTRPQVEVLDAMFEVNPSPSRKVKDELASGIGMTPKQVQVRSSNFLDDRLLLRPLTPICTGLVSKQVTQLFILQYVDMVI